MTTTRDRRMSRRAVDGRRDLLEIDEARHQRKSILIASQIPVQQWPAVIGERRPSSDRRSAQPSGGGRAAVDGRPPENRRRHGLTASRARPGIRETAGKRALHYRSGTLWQYCGARSPSRLGRIGGN
ncbi:MAG: hypothetical protein OXF79_15145 [Chloroflexi bacterium]|nr:hypothetical protein [Chloroflexota bacterium]